MITTSIEFITWFTMFNGFGLISESDLKTCSGECSKTTGCNPIFLSHHTAKIIHTLNNAMTQSQLWSRSINHTRVFSLSTIINLVLHSIVNSFLYCHKNTSNCELSIASYRAHNNEIEWVIFFSMRFFILPNQ